MSLGEDDLRVKLINSINMIESLVEDLLSSTTPFFTQKEDQSKLLENINDIEKIQSSILLLKNELKQVKEIQLSENYKQNLQKPEYLSKIRHDLRNPINAIMGYAELVAEDLQQKNFKFLVEKCLNIVNVCRNILNLIDEIRATQSEFRSISVAIDSRTHELVIDSKSNEMIQEAEAEEAINPSEKDSLNPIYHHFKETFSILVVDDVEENCQLLHRYLNNLGYRQIYMAHDGYQALEEMKKHKIDLILLDIVMPNMNGIELLKHLKKQNQEHQFMVLMITGADTIENDIECIKLGALDVLSKPFNVDILRVRIGSCLERKWFMDKEAQYRKQIEIDKQKYQELLYAIFPPVIVEELICNNHIPTRIFNNVAVLFCDVVGFTSYCNSHDLNDVIKNIQDFAEICETAAFTYNLQKIKTIGDGFLAISGLLQKRSQPVWDCIQCGKDIIKGMAALEAKWTVRIGIDYGPVIGGIVGHRQYLYDVWSDTVNTASRIQALAKPNSIYLSEAAYEEIKDFCQCESLGEHHIKGKNPISIFCCQSASSSN